MAVRVNHASYQKDRPHGVSESTFAVRRADEGLFNNNEWQRVGDRLGLSQRELEIVRRIIEGKKLFSIARELNLALGTVKTYSQRVYHKLGVGDQRELTVTVVRAYLHLLALNTHLTKTEDPPYGAIRA